MLAPVRILPILLAGLLAACDSSSLYTADLGQGGVLEPVKAVSVPPPAGAQVQILGFVAPPGGTLPSQWRSAQSVKVQINGTLIPLAAAVIGASPSLEASIPLTLGYSPPLANATVPMVFAINGDHVMLAEVSF